jgi:hypothetical protein
VGGGVDQIGHGRSFVFEPEPGGASWDLRIKKPSKALRAREG